MYIQSPQTHLSIFYGDATIVKAPKSGATATFYVFFITSPVVI